MSAEQVPSPDPSYYPDDLKYDQAIDSPVVEDELSEHRYVVRLEARLNLLQNFYNYARDCGYEPLTEERHYMPDLSHAAHDFLHESASEVIARIRQKHPDRPGYPGLLHKQTITKYIDQYYERYDRDLSYLERQKRDIFINEAKSGLNHRQETFPEIFAADQLYLMLRRHNRLVAAESVDVVRIAYGRRAGRMVNFISHYRDFERRNRRVVSAEEIRPYLPERE